MQLVLAKSFIGNCKIILKDLQLQTFINKSDRKNTTKSRTSL